MRLVRIYRGILFAMENEGGRNIPFDVSDGESFFPILWGGTEDRLGGGVERLDLEWLAVRVGFLSCSEIADAVEVDHRGDLVGNSWVGLGRS